jgi:hypothetical protein
MNFETTEARNDCAEEGQQQFNPPADRQLSQLRVADVESEKLVAEAGDNSGTYRKGNVSQRKPLPTNG